MHGSVRPVRSAAFALIIQARPARRRRRRGAIALAIAATSLALPGANAGTSTWTGNGATNNWSDPANWSALPASSADTSIVFAGTNRLSNTQNISSDFLLNSLTFNSGAASR